MTDEDKLVLVSGPADGVLLCRLNRPRQRNALSAALLIQVADILVQAAIDPETRCVVLTGDDVAFSAGADITEMERDGFHAIEKHERQVAWRTIERFPKPLVAAVNGICFGGGHELALLCDIVIASDTARFAQPEINIGIIPGDGATQRVTRSVGKSLAMKMMLTGEPIDAATAMQAGLVAEVVAPERTLDRAFEIAATIAQKAPIAAKLAKEAVLAAYETPLSAGLDVERRAIRLAFTTADQKEGMAAFVAKRPAQFTGR